MLTSLHNPQVKNVVLLSQKAAVRRRSGLFVVEGRREVEQCLAAGYEIETLFVCPEIMGEYEASVLTAAERVDVSPAVYDKMAYRGGTEGMLAIVHIREQRLSDLPAVDAPLYIVLESVEKPGNLGAILRSADAARADAVFVCDERCDLYNPNLLRSSLGACFTVPTIACTSQACISFLRERGVNILTAQLQDSILYYSADMTRPTALVMGAESTGLSQQWREAADAHIRIPMLGHLDSLNVSVSTAILLFEAVRQRHQQ